MCQFVEDKGDVVFFRNANGLGEQTHFTNVRRVLNRRLLAIGRPGPFSFQCDHVVMLSAYSLLLQGKYDALRSN